MTDNLIWQEFLEQNMVAFDMLQDGILERLESLDDPSTAVSFSTGIKALDQFVKFGPEMLYIVGGRSNVGKTAISFQMVSAVLKQMRNQEMDGFVAVFSAEMSADQIAVREGCREYNLDSRRIFFETDAKEDRRMVREYIKDRDWSQLLIDQSSSPSITHMIEQLERWQQKGPIRFILFDYMGLSGEIGGNEALRIGEVSRLLKGLAKRFSAPVLAVHQFSRDIERRQDKRPQMSDMLFGGEQPADFIFGMVEKTDDLGTPMGNMIEFHVTKSRFSEKGGYMNLYLKKPGLEFAGGQMNRVDLEETYGEALA